ncbi:hypothetical protein EV646_10992 [Kribbella antiqua]|uniref:Uncharacterized protein n=2 Tax=Kribbella antiqua TaxID=2512217 RepID=A0A4V6NNI4_9ACTN|nr:hypothetical protein EV646_10992 [Kribbella antiqua]
MFMADLPDGTFVYKEIPPDMVWPEPPADLDPSIDWRLWPDIDPADRRSSTHRAAGQPNQDDPEAEARERYNREAPAKAERLRQAGGRPPDPFNNPGHPLYQPPDQPES